MFTVSVEYLFPVYTGNYDWPPSPRRLLSALVAAAGRARMDNGPLRWLEQQPAPVIIAPRVEWVENTRYVPGNDSKMGTHEKTAHTVPEAHLAPGRQPVTYCWSSDPSSDEFEALARITARAAVLGRGTDLIVARAATVASEPPMSNEYDRWVPSTTAHGPVFRRGRGNDLRVPRPGAVDAMDRIHAGRSAGTVHTLPASCEEVVRYVRDVEADDHVAVYRLDYRDCAFPADKAVMIAGMMRHAVSLAASAAGCSDEWIRSVVLGHGTDHTHRVGFLPLPSIIPDGYAGGRLGNVQRIAITQTPGMRSTCRRLNGQELVTSRGDVVARLELMSDTDAVVERYLAPASDWVTVTPMVMSGHIGNAGLDGDKARRVLARDLDWVGWSDCVEAVWMHPLGSLPGTQRARNYWVASCYDDGRPRVHLRVRFRRPRRGPHVIGAGRYMGTGLLARAAW